MTAAHASSAAARPVPPAGRRRSARQGRGEPADARVDRLAAPLDQAVGEGAQQRARRDEGRGGPPMRVVGGADRRVRPRGSRSAGPPAPRVPAGGGPPRTPRTRRSPGCTGRTARWPSRPARSTGSSGPAGAVPSRVGGLEDVGAQRAAHPAHDDSGGQPRSRHVSDHDAQSPVRQHEHVVPVAADIAGAGHVPRRQLDARHARAAPSAAGCGAARARPARRPAPSWTAGRAPPGRRPAGAARRPAARTAGRSASRRAGPR